MIVSEAKAKIKNRWWQILFTFFILCYKDGDDDGDDNDDDNDDGDDDDDDEEVVANFVQLLLCHKECRDQIRAGYIQMAAQRILTLR